jgi:dsDNA-binding SOS-regulon protein
MSDDLAEWQSRALTSEAQLQHQLDRIHVLSTELAKTRAALAGILRNHETIGAGASIFQCTTAEANAARAALSV